MIFRRKKDAAADASETAADEAAAVGDAADAAEAGEPDGDEPVDRSNGPFDVFEADEPDAMAAQRIDLGAVQVPLFEGLEIRVEIDEAANMPVAVTLIRGDGAVQVRAFSAPRSGGTWAEARTEIRRSITGDGGTVDEGHGDFGPELRAAVPAQDEKGNRALQPIRFVGVDGPRWMLQGVFLGVGTQPELAGELEEVFRGIVVVRGDEAMPPGSALPLSLPEQVPGDVTEVGDAEQDVVMPAEDLSEPAEDDRG